MKRVVPLIESKIYQKLVQLQQGGYQCLNCNRYYGRIYCHTSTLNRPATGFINSIKFPVNLQILTTRCCSTPSSNDTSSSIAATTTSTSVDTDHSKIHCKSENDKQHDLGAAATHSTLVVGDGKVPVKEITVEDFNRVFPHRKKTDFSARYTENKAITKRRALRDYHVRDDDLQGLPSIAVFNPYGTGSRITELYLQSDVERRSIEIWGSREKLEKERQLRAIQERMTGVTGAPGSYDHSEHTTPLSWWQHFQEGSGRVVKWAVLINFGNFIAKLVAWRITSSHSIFAEMIHSAADTINQIILAIGIHQSIKQPDPDHPYGYSNVRYVSSLISGVGIFCLGGGLSIYHGIQGLLHPEPVQPLLWAIATLGVSVLTESVTLMIAVNEIKQSSKHNNMMFWEYVFRGSDPHVNVVLLEDLAAVAGAGVAGLCLAMSYYSASPLADSMGSIIVGCMLASVAGVIIYTNSVALVGRAMPDSKQQDIVETLEADRCVRSVLDVKTVDVGSNCYRFKAEIFFDGREITKFYLDYLDMEILEMMVAECQNIKTIDDLDRFLLKHGDNIVDKVGEQTKRIETIIKQNHPQVRHVDLEAIGRGGKL